MRFRHFPPPLVIALIAPAPAGAQGQAQTHTPVPQVKTQAPESITITVLGQVVQPGNHMVRPGISVAEAIVRAGGAREVGDVTKVFVIHRQAASPITVDLTVAPDLNSSTSRTMLQEGSLIMVREKERYVRVIGAVMRPGVYPYPASGSLTVAQALSLASGIWAGVSIDKIALKTPHTSVLRRTTFTKEVEALVPVSEINTTLLNNKATVWVISKGKPNP